MQKCDQFQALSDNSVRKLNLSMLKWERTLLFQSRKYNERKSFNPYDAQ